MERVRRPNLIRTNMEGRRGRAPPLYGRPELQEVHSAKQLPEDVVKNILEIAAKLISEKPQTRAGLAREISRRIASGRDHSSMVQHILDAAESEGKIKLPEKSRFGGARKKGQKKSG